jgi:hypothetical protein
MKPIHIKSSHVGRLHAALGVPKGQKLSSIELMHAKGSANPKVRKMAAFALAAKGWNH